MLLCKIAVIKLNQGQAPLVGFSRKSVHNFVRNLTKSQQTRQTEQITEPHWL